MLRASVFVVSALLGACNAGGGGGGGGGDTDASTTPDMTVGNDTGGGGNDATMGGDRAPTGDGPNCGAGSANCGACTPLPSCGWCRRTNSCVPGNSMGATAGGCMGADWAYLPSQCGGDGGTPGDAAPPNCSAGTMGCAACAPLPGCGWSRRTNSCVPGSSMGSTTGGCMGADWAYLPSQCGGDGGTGDGGTSCASGVPRACNLTLSGAVRTCTAGQMVRVGCNQGCGLGSCTGDAVMQICPGNATTPCAMAIASNDDAPDSAMCTMGPDGGAGSDLCPLVTFMCPADGRYTVWVGAFGSGMATCMAAVR
jgi:hypothetical protein